ncbi:uncharacterized protein PFL1_01412 [Pseudozyma flocculosa PF-1]|uniref:Ribokinase n=1 Tax=Pseudozyma flocculosa TaxID=84751 RepID=A0A5C3EY04_9BASI|nr:uncharacterized protein PFL1_01412 [Pseudozyma flocculosa PF-1]EPQ31227.1 hypothetical protein PFL1_01412 [Pseudozyma flocculosa PF-1]SPO36277.1 related to RBK1 - putative ribokinase [Pseudozyma flocculosa]
MASSSSSSSNSAPFCLVKSSINVDETFDVPHIVAPGETLSSTGLTSRPGGKGANVSAAIALAGAPVRFSGAVGSDAPWPLDELACRGVDIDGVETLKDQPTGRAFIQIAADGENSIVLLKGANYATSSSTSDPETVFSSAPRLITHLVVHNEIPLAVTTAFLEYAQRTRSGGQAPRITSIFNPSPMPTPDELRSFPWSAIDVLIVNEGEGSELLNALDARGADAVPSDLVQGSDERSRRVVDALADLEALKHTAWIVLTRGSRGVMARIQVAPAASPAQRTFFSLPSPKPRQVRDTTGAGDTFAGNLVAALMGVNLSESAARNADGDDVESATQQASAAAKSDDHVNRVLTWACMAASVACETVGAMRSIPKAEDVKARLA